MTLVPQEGHSVTGSWTCNVLVTLLGTGCNAIWGVMRKYHEYSQAKWDQNLFLSHQIRSTVTTKEGHRLPPFRTSLKVRISPLTDFTILIFYLPRQQSFRLFVCVCEHSHSQAVWPIYVCVFQSIITKGLLAKRNVHWRNAGDTWMLRRFHFL